MTVTVNSLGPNSAEIVVVNEATAQPAMNAVENFIISKGWTRVTGVGNNYERIYSSANLTTGTKFIKINAMDMHIDHAEAYSGTTTVAATNPAFRRVSNDHLDYEKNLYADSNSSTPASSSIIFTGTSVIGGSLSLSIPAGLPEVLYPQQYVRLISRSEPNTWLDCVIASHNNVTGAVTMHPYAAGTGNNGDTLTDWSILTHTVKYNTASPSYIYVSASARHVAIQVKYRDGSYGDWHAVLETENPVGAAIPSILTTGYMVSNSGYTNRMSNTSSASSPLTNTVSPSSTSIFGSHRLWCGPYSQPRSRLNRTGVTASRFSKISTPIGDAGPIGSQQRFALGRAVSGSSIAHYMENLVYYKGMGDVIPNIPEPVTEKQWAFSGSAVTDLTENADWTDLSINTWPGAKTSLTFNSFDEPSGSINYSWSSVREQSSWLPVVPTLLGRIYGIKFVTSGLAAGNILSIKVDPNGFADESGIAQDHLVMSYQSQFVADSRQGTSFTQGPVQNALTIVDQATIRQSRTASVAFPK